MRLWQEITSDNLRCLGIACGGLNSIVPATSSKSAIVPSFLLQETVQDCLFVSVCENILASELLTVSFGRKGKRSHRAAVDFGSEIPCCPRSIPGTAGDLPSTYA